MGSRKIMAAGLLALSLLAGTAFADAQPWPLAVRLMSYGKYQDAAWAHLQSIGVKHIFLPVPAPADMEATMKKLKDHGLDAPVVRGSAELSKDSFVADITAQLDVCAKMGVKYMFLSAKREGVALEEAHARLRAAGDAAKAKGVTITLETHPDLGTNGDVQVQTMKAVNHPNVRVNFDTANITYYNKNTSAVAELKKSLALVGTVEFKDHNGEFETWNFPVLGQGVVDFPAIVKLLRDNKYAGPVTLEFEGVKGTELNEEQTKQAIADTVAYARSLKCFD